MHPHKGCRVCKKACSTQLTAQLVKQKKAQRKLKRPRLLPRVNYAVTRSPSFLRALKLAIALDYQGLVQLATSSGFLAPLSRRFSNTRPSGRWIATAAAPLYILRHSPNHAARRWWREGCTLRLCHCESSRANRPGGARRQEGLGWRGGPRSGCNSRFEMTRGSGRFALGQTTHVYVCRHLCV